MDMTSVKIRMRTGHFAEPGSSRIPYSNALRWHPRGERKNRVSPAVDVFFSQKAFLNANTSASSDLDNEVGGWLIGKRRMDRLVSLSVLTFSAAAGAQKLVQPLPDSNFSPLRNRALPQMQRSEHSHPNPPGQLYRQ